ncbi:MAG: Fic family protein [Thermoleophilia bacterium]|nr:Fic family protein [Thermoleophilia bacterium]
MATPTRTFLLEDQREVFLSTADTSRAVGRAVKAGRARKIGNRLYTRNTAEPLEAVVRRNWQRIAALYFPNAVVVDRSAFEAMPSDDGSLFLDGGPRYAGRRPVRLPGLTLRPRRGAGPVGGDMPFMENLHFAGPGRKFLDNMRPSRAPAGSTARTLSRAELENELTSIAALRGSEALNEVRDRAREVAGALGAEREMAALDALIGAVLGTTDAVLSTAAARAHRQGLGFDPRRLRLFEALQSRLLQSPQPNRPAQPNSLPALSFIEAYFSNWIEGTEFRLDEAEEIVFDGAVPEGRTEDAHDVLGTFELVNEPGRRGQAPADAEDLLDLLRANHGIMLARRPAARPGSFKAKPNQAGGTVFVHPDLVSGTLTEGFRYYEALPEGFARAVFMMFLVSEVHPFSDGNGRLARVMMNADLTSVDLQRIVVPLSFRDDYMQSLRALSRSADPRPFVRVMDYLQQYAATIDWSDLKRSQQALSATNAFVTPDLAEESGVRLLLPDGAGP